MQFQLGPVVWKIKLKDRHKKNNKLHKIIFALLFHGSYVKKPNGQMYE